MKIKYKNIPLLVLISFCAFSVQAQTIERSVIGAAGFSLQNSDCQVNFTMGELIASTEKTDTLTLTQGFHQGILNFNVSILNADKPIDINIYPNPATAGFNIQFMDNSMGYNIDVFDVLGKLILSKPVSIYESIAKVNTSSFSSGMYVIRLRAKDNSFTYTERVRVIK